MEERYIFVKEVSETATRLDDLTIVNYKNESKAQAEHWGEQILRIVQHLVPWGKAGVVKQKELQQNWPIRVR